MSTKQQKIYISSAAWHNGHQVTTKYQSGCLRYVFVQAHGNPPRSSSINPASQGLGALSEEALAAQFRRRRLKHEREVPFRQEFKGVILSGRMDFVVTRKEDQEVWENKASTSTYVLKDAIQGGQPDANYIAQLVSYLAFNKIARGYLNVNYYQLGENQKDWDCTDTRTFEIVLRDDGVILVDGNEYDKVLRDLSRWYAEAVKVVSDPSTVPGEPRLDPIPYKNPCHFCPLQAVCKSHKDAPMDSAQFLQQAVSAMSVPQPTRAFNFTTVKKEKEEG